MNENNEVKENDTPSSKTSAEESAVGVLEETQKKAEENWNLYLRARADMDNLRRRSEIDLENARKFGVERFARELLGVVDSLEHGVQVAETAHDSAYKEGMMLTLKLFFDTLEKFNVIRMQPNVGDPFDPGVHEAISLTETNDAAPNTVLMVAQPGFTLNGRVLRHARVVVAKAAASQAPNS